MGAPQRYRLWQNLPLCSFNKEDRIWPRIIVAYLIPGTHFTSITHHRACLVSALTTNVPINDGAVIRLAMQKARVHKGVWFNFRSLVTENFKTMGSRRTWLITSLLGTWEGLMCLRSKSPILPIGQFSRLRKGMHEMIASSVTYMAWLSWRWCVAVEHLLLKSWGSWTVITHEWPCQSNVPSGSDL